MAKTRIQVLSDLHLETPAAYDVFTIPPHSSTLALLRDIRYVQDAGFFDFLQQQLSNFRLVFFVIGNHEPYHSNWANVKTRLGRLSQDMQKWFLEGKIAREFIVLDQTRYDIPGKSPYVYIALLSPDDILTDILTG